MLITFIIFLICFIIEIFIIGIIFSKIEINIDNLELSKINKNSQIRDFRGTIKINLFKKIKLIQIGIYKSHLKIFGIKIKYDKFFKIYKYKRFEMIIIKNIKIIKEYIKSLFSKNLRIEIEKLNLIVDLGTENSFFTAILSSIISTIIPLIIQKYIDEYDFQKYNYKINPNYFNINNVKIKIEVIVSVETYKLLEEIDYIKKNKLLHQN